MTSPLSNSNSDEIKIVYDGECPICNNYVQMVRLKESVKIVSLIDARKNDDYVTAMLDRNLDINQGMLVIYGNQLYYASDAMNILALLTGKTSWMNRIVNAVFRHRALAQLFYPLCKSGRNLLLFLLNRSKIDHH